MKKTTFPIIAFLLFLVLSAEVYSEEKIILATQNWPPYQTYRNDAVDGFAVQVVKCVLEKMGQSYEIGVYPWRRAQNMVKVGRAHGFFSASRNQKRDQYATISDNIAEQKWNWYLLKEGSIRPMHTSFKKEAKVAAMFGSNMLTWLKENGYKVAGTPKNTESLIKTLLIKRYDAMLANELVVNNALKKMDLSHEQFQIYLNKDMPLGVYWGKTFLSENPGFLEQFNMHIKKCRCSEN